MVPKDKKPASTAPAGDRIAKVLSRAGIASRREAERMIDLGEVTVNGKVITSPALNVTASDKITVRGEAVGAPDVPRLWLYYKPEGLVTSTSDEKGRDTVFDHLPEDMPRVMSIGRLDLNSEGLLLLTNDGGLKRRLELPSTGWLRKYRVRVKGNPTEPEIEPLRRGITIDGERFQPMEVKIDRHQGANAWLTVGLREGRNREIRRAMDHIGVTVNRLIRVSYGPFRLNEMEPGEVEEVRGKVLRDQLGMAEDAPGPQTRKPRPAARAAKPLADGKPMVEAKPKAEAPLKQGRRPLKPGAALKTLSETWQKATRPPSRKDTASKDPTRKDTATRAPARKDPAHKDPARRDDDTKPAPKPAARAKPATRAKPTAPSRNAPRPTKPPTKPRKP